MTPTETRLASRRRAIHASARQLGLTEDERRDLIAGQCDGKRSTTDLDLAECDKVLNRMRRLGAARPDGEKYIGRHPGYPETCRRGCGARMEKVEALLANMKLPWAYGRTILKHVSAKGAKGRVGVDRFEWATADHLDGVIAALDYEQTKRHTLAGLDHLLQERGLTRTWCEDLIKAQAPEQLRNWTRHVKTLEALIRVLEAM